MSEIDQIRKEVEEDRAKWVIIGYPKYEGDEDKTIFTAQTKREVIGLVKTMIDNFEVSHIDIMNTKKFDQETEELKKAVKE